MRPGFQVATMRVICFLQVVMGLARGYKDDLSNTTATKEMRDLV